MAVTEESHVELPILLLTPLCLTSGEKMDSWKDESLSDRHSVHPSDTP